MFSSRPAPNRCKEPGHVFSELTGRCKTCRMLRRREKVAVSPALGRPRGAETVQGKPCRTCGATERYKNSMACTACQRRHGFVRGTVNTSVYHISLEFLQWARSPAPESTNV
jgi:hypothetical protein